MDSFRRILWPASAKLARSTLKCCDQQPHCPITEGPGISPTTAPAWLSNAAFWCQEKGLELAPQELCLWSQVGEWSLRGHQRYCSQALLRADWHNHCRGGAALLGGPASLPFWAERSYQDAKRPSRGCTAPTTLAHIPQNSFFDKAHRIRIVIYLVNGSDYSFI